MFQRFRIYHDKWLEFANSARGSYILKIGRFLILLAILAFLAYKLFQIGWQSVWDHLPDQFLFYLIFLILYFMLPVIEIFIYRITWDFNSWESIPIFIKKRIFNTDILGYSGEAYFFIWAKDKINQPNTQIAETIRDNNILSSVASNTVTLLTLGLFYHIQHPLFQKMMASLDVHYIVPGAIILLVVIVPLIFRFRKFIFSMPLKISIIILAIQLARMILGQVLVIWQWNIAIPSVSLSTWITYATISIVLTRIPFPSNKNLVFMGIGVEVADNFGIPQAAMFGLLGTIVAMQKVLNISLFLIFSLIERNNKFSKGNMEVQQKT